MTVPVIGVLALQGDVREHAHTLSAVGARAVSVRRESELDTVDGLVIPGGESTTMDKLLRAFDLLEPIRQRVKDGMPAYGSCAGMIMLADRVVDAIEGQQTIGGIDMAVRRNAFGRQVDSFEEDVALRGLPAEERPMRAVFIRAPWVESIGPEVNVIATVRGGRPRQGAAARRPADIDTPSVATSRGATEPADRTRIVAVRQGPLLATAFHPELTGDLRVHQFFVDHVRAGSDGTRVAGLTGVRPRPSIVHQEG